MENRRLVVSKDSRTSTAITLTVGQMLDANFYGERLHTTFAPISTGTLEAARPPLGACRLSLTDASVLVKNSNVPDPLNGLTTREDAAVYLGDYTLSIVRRRNQESKTNTSYVDKEGENWYLNGAQRPSRQENSKLYAKDFGPVNVPPGQVFVPVKELSEDGRGGLSYVVLDLGEGSDGLSGSDITPTFFTLKPGLYQSVDHVTDGIVKSLTSQYSRFKSSTDDIVVLARPQVRFQPTESGRMAMHLFQSKSEYPAYKKKGGNTVYLNPSAWSIRQLRGQRTTTVSFSLSYMVAQGIVFWNSLTSGDEAPSLVLTYRFFNNAGFTSKTPTLSSEALGIRRKVNEDEVVVQTFIIGISGSETLMLDAGDLSNARSMVSADGLCTALCLGLPAEHVGTAAFPNFTVLKTNDIASVEAHYKLEGQDLAELSYLTGQILRYSALSGHLINTGQTTTDIYPSAGTVRPLATDDTSSRDKVLVLHNSYDHPLRNYPTKPDGTSFDLNRMGLVLSLSNSNGDIIPIIPGSRITLSLLACHLERL